MCMQSHNHTHRSLEEEPSRFTDKAMALPAMALRCPCLPLKTKKNKVLTRCASVVDLGGSLSVVEDQLDQQSHATIRCAVQSERPSWLSDPSEPGALAPGFAPGTSTRRQPSPKRPATLAPCRSLRRYDGPVLFPQGPLFPKYGALFSGRFPIQGRVRTWGKSHLIFAHSLDTAQQVAGCNIFGRRLNRTRPQLLRV